MTFSLVNYLDGSENCMDGSTLGYGGIVLWVALAIYIFIGLYVLCEHYFVPSLTILGEKLNLSEDVCGATLMAAGSSSPELFTAIIGVFLYPNENPGPSTNCASAAFNMCVIVGLSIICSGLTQSQLRSFPFIRDAFFYGIAALALYVFYELISPGAIEFGEAFGLVLIWVVYVFVLYFDEYVRRSIVWFGRCSGLMTNNAQHMILNTYSQLPDVEQIQIHNHNNNININNNNNNNNSNFYDTKIEYANSQHAKDSSFKVDMAHLDDEEKNKNKNKNNNKTFDEHSPLTKPTSNNNNNNNNNNDASSSDESSDSSSNGSFSNSDDSYNNETAATTDYETIASRKGDNDNDDDDGDETGNDNDKEREERDRERERESDENKDFSANDDDLTAMIHAYYPDSAVFHNKRKKKIVFKRQAFEVDSSNEQDSCIVTSQQPRKTRGTTRAEDKEAAEEAGVGKTTTTATTAAGIAGADASMYYVTTELTPEVQDEDSGGIGGIKIYGSNSNSHSNTTNNNNNRTKANSSSSSLDSRINETELQRTLRNIFSRLFNWMIKPFDLIFSRTIPKVNDDIGNCKLSISFIASIIWMAILSWLVVDLSTKIGTCLALTPDFMGLTLLAVGSSVPDTFSSILVARQGKMGMAVSNALGSNVFDICICVGLSFMLKSMMIKGNDILVETNLGYQSFIIALFVLLALFVGLMYWSNLIITVKHGWFLLASYILFLVIFGFVLEEEENA